jgi:allophanate hydrolase
MNADGTPFGVTFLAPAGSDAMLASIGRVFHVSTGLPLGAIGCVQPPLRPLSSTPLAGEVAIAVVGAHLSGLRLNGELRRSGGRLLEATTSAANYRLYALPDSTPPKPGLLRVKHDRGTAIALEMSALSTEAFGGFVAAVPPPLSIGTIALADGREVKGFLVEADAVADARDISSFGGWRSFLASQEAVAASPL